MTTIAARAVALTSSRLGGALLATVLAAGVGCAAALAPLPAILAMVAIGVAVAVALHPPLAAYLLLATTPLVVGIDRGQALPVLRPNEAITLLVAAGLALRFLVTWSPWRPAEAARRVGRVDAAIVALAISGSVLPLLWMVARGRHISHDDVLYALVLWKYYVVYLVVRHSIDSERQVARCLTIVLAASAVVGAIGIVQSLGVGAVTSFLNNYYSPLGAGALVSGRASSTMGSSFSVADVMTFCLAISGARLVHGSPRKVLLGGLTALFAIATLASGEFSAVIGLVVAALTFGYLTRRLGRTFLALLGTALVAGIVLQPVIQKRLADRNPGSGLPASWTDRLDNLRTFFWPDLGAHYNWLTGVRPTAQLPNPQNRLGFVWIESGHTWLLWTGGVAMLVAFFVFLWVTMRAVLAVVRARSDAIGVAAVASFTALAVMAVLMTFDPHLTLRGSADLSFALLAMALVGGPPRRTQAQGIATSAAP